MKAWLARHRSLLLLAALLAIGVVIAVATTPRGVGEPLAPDNPAPDGARAVAQILQSQGVEVREQTALADVLGRAGEDTTLLVLDAGVLPPDRLRELRASGADLVLVDPSLPVLQVLAPELSLGGRSESYTADPGCDDADAVAAGQVRGGGNRYVRASGGALPGVSGESPSPTAGVELCYASGTGTNPDAGSYAVVTDGTDRRIVVHGQPELLSNQWLAEEGNAALALRSLGGQDTLIWYRVDPFDVALASDEEVPPTAIELLPRWVLWVVLQLLLTALVAIIWRSRRLGRLVPERLPAVVRSAETTEGRARLYRAAGARAAGAQVLRRATVRRLAARLSTGSHATPATVARLVATANGEDPLEVGRILHGPDPTDDAGLVRLADQLDRLEREVTHR